MGGQDAAQGAATGKKWSVRPHEPLIGMVILSVAFVIGSSLVDSGLRSRNQPVTDRSGHSHRFCRTDCHRRYLSNGTPRWRARSRRRRRRWRS